MPPPVSECKIGKTVAAAYRRYDELHYWLVASDDLANATDVIADDTFGLATDLVVATPFEDGYDLFDVYNPFKTRGGKLNVTYFGCWNSSDGLRVSLSQNKYDRKSNLHGMVWKVSFFGVKYRAPRVSLEEHFQDLERTGTKDGLSKFGFNIVKHVAELFNFTMVLNEYGKWTRNDRMGPITKALQYDEIDISGTPISVFTDKENEQQTELFNRTKWQKLAENDRFILPEKGVQLVKQGGFAYHAHPEFAYPYIKRSFDNREICELTEVHLAKPSYRSMAVPLNISFIEISRRGFTKLTEVGIRSRQLRRWKASKPPCRKDILSVASTNMYELAPHLILLVIGMMLAVILLTIEIMHFNSNESKGYTEKKLNKYTQEDQIDFYI